MTDFPFKTECDVCKKLLDFNNIKKSKEEVILFNYYDLLVNGVCVVIICSIKCKTELRKSIIDPQVALDVDLFVLLINGILI